MRREKAEPARGATLSFATQLPVNHYVPTLFPALMSTIAPIYLVHRPLSLRSWRVFCGINEGSTVPGCTLSAGNRSGTITFTRFITHLSNHIIHYKLSHMEHILFKHIAVITFKSDDCKSLEYEINEWLSKYPEYSLVTPIAYSTSQIGYGIMHYALITYSH